MIMSFQQRLRASRKRKHMTIEEVANEIGVAKSTYAGYESNYREPSLAMVRSIAAILHTSVDYLLGITSNPLPLNSELNLKIILRNPLIYWDDKHFSKEELQSIIVYIERIVYNGDTR